MTWLYADAVELGYDIPNCGTAACIAGWVVALVRKMTPRRAESLALGVPYAGNKLHIPPEAQERLFFKPNWPKRFQGGKTPSTRARRAVARIDAFIESGGKI